MLLGGLQKTTLIDFPGRVACTVFTVGCNFRCPFCHNRDLVTLALFQKSGFKQISEKDFFAFLANRKKILEGVTITGGEPTLQVDLPSFCQKIKDLGLEVKLDTNGSNPKMLKKLIDEKLVDFIAMDIKTCYKDYLKLVNPKSEARNSRQILNSNFQNYKLLDIDKIKETIKIILTSGLEYELRTTVVPGIHNKEVMVKLAKELKNEVEKVDKSSGKVEKINYILQNFRPQNCLDPQYLKLKPFSDKEIQAILKSVQPILSKTKLRGTE